MALVKKSRILKVLLKTAKELHFPQEIIDQLEKDCSDDRQEDIDMDRLEAIDKMVALDQEMGLYDNLADPVPPKCTSVRDRLIKRGIDPDTIKPNDSDLVAMSGKRFEDDSD
jgi:hypothetical protein